MKMLSYTAPFIESCSNDKGDSLRNIIQKYSFVLYSDRANDFFSPHIYFWRLVVSICPARKRD
jgi:hypothetical protein